ncbi:MAG: hypothetical protein JKY49_00070 [Cohaesibacteraceae bacterium]|nr:hypothetical protein [Cohaesibacteraceae bacterium]MBL4875997.1 hypothetical protein [Cohaesibacteraceae bacterium]
MIIYTLKKRSLQISKGCSKQVCGAKTHAGRYLPLVFSNEPIERLLDLRERLRVAWIV